MIQNLIAIIRVLLAAGVVLVMAFVPAFVTVLLMLNNIAVLASVTVLLMLNNVTVVASIAILPMFNNVPILASNYKPLSIIRTNNQ